MNNISPEQKELLQTYWKTLYLLYGQTTFGFWGQPEHLEKIYWEISKNFDGKGTHTTDMIIWGYSTEEPPTFKFTDKFVKEIINQNL